MIIKCLSIDATSLDELHFQLGFTPRSRLALTVGKEYMVYSIAYWGRLLFTLVFDEDDMPSWYPLDLFEVTDPSISPNWFFATFKDDSHPIKAIWGYEKIVMNHSHLEGISEHDQKEMQVLREIQATSDFNNRRMN